jgi:hypothetical protein
MFQKWLPLALLALLPSPAYADWQQAQSKHFTVYSNDDPAQVREVATQLERYDAALRLLMNMPDTRPTAAIQRVTVYVVPDVEAVQRISRLRNVAGFFEGRVPGPLAFVPRSTGPHEDWNSSAQEIIFHEYVHYFMATSWPDVVFPLWFSEGFADFNSTARFNRDGQIVFGAVPTSRAYGLTRQAALDARQMVLHTDEKLDDEQMYVLYSRGWLLTHYLLLDKERSKLFGAYLAALNSGKSPAEAAKALGDLHDLDGKMNAYLAHRTLPTSALSEKQLSIGEVSVRAVSPGEAATMMARIRSQAGVDEKSAKEVVALARDAAAPFPNDAAAQNELAEAEFDAGNTAASEAAADRAIAADPKSVHALIYKGMVHMRLAATAKSTDPKVWAEARKWYIEANRADTENPWPLELYYDSFAAAHEKPTKNAEAALAYAFALAPFDISLRRRAAMMYLEQNDAAKARAALEPLAYSPHGGEAAAFATKLVAALDSEGPAKALALVKEYDENLKAKAGQAEKDKKDKK